MRSKPFFFTAYAIFIRMILTVAAVSFPVLAYADVAPQAAAAAGYTVNSFSSNFTAKTVDTNATERSGYLWYNWDMFGSRSNTKAVELNADGSVTLHGDHTSAELVTAVQDRTTHGFVGSTFGGGAYIEAELKFDPKDVAKSTESIWPAFWSLHLEGNIIPDADQWKNQPKGYRHSLEADFFEAMRKLPPYSYGASLHDWFGVYNETCGHGLCQVGMPSHMGIKTAPTGTDFTQYHRYGFLWVPATKQTHGYAKFYFDDQQVNETQEWTLFEDQSPPPTNQSWAFGVLDQRHLFLILGTGIDQPMTVRSVNVWQANTLSNLYN